MRANLVEEDEASAAVATAVPLSTVALLYSCDCRCCCCCSVRDARLESSTCLASTTDDDAASDDFLSKDVEDDDATSCTCAQTGQFKSLISSLVKYYMRDDSSITSTSGGRVVYPKIRRSVIKVLV